MVRLVLAIFCAGVVVAGVLDTVATGPHGGLQLPVTVLGTPTPAVATRNFETHTSLTERIPRRRKRYGVEPHTYGYGPVRWCDGDSCRVANVGWRLDCDEYDRACGPPRAGDRLRVRTLGPFAVQHDNPAALISGSSAWSRLGTALAALLYYATVSGAAIVVVVLLVIEPVRITRNAVRARRRRANDRAVGQ